MQPDASLSKIGQLYKIGFWITDSSKLSRGEILWQISYPPANGVCLGSYSLPKSLYLYCIELISMLETLVVWCVDRTSCLSCTKGDLGERGEGILTSQSN